MSNQHRVTKEIGGKLIQGGFPANLQYLRFNSVTNQWEFVLIASPIVSYFNSNKKTGSINGDRFFPLFSDSTGGSGTESGVQIIIDDAFTVTRLRINVDLNTKDADTTVHFRDDGADVTSITVGAAATGPFDSGAVSVAVGAGSNVNHRIDTSLSTLGNIAINVIMTTFQR